MTDTYHLVVFWLVVAACFLVPLLIPRYPLPAVLAVKKQETTGLPVFLQTGGPKSQGVQLDCQSFFGLAVLEEQ